MNFIIQYNVFYKYIINATTTAINTSKKLFDFGQRKVICLYTYVTDKGEPSIIYSQSTNIDTVEKGEKKGQTL